MDIPTESIVEAREMRRNNVDFEDIITELDLSTEELSLALYTEFEDVSVERLDSAEDEPWMNQFLLIELYVNEKLTFTEIATVLDCHPETVKLWVQRIASPKVKRVKIQVTEDFNIRVTDDREFEKEIYNFSDEFFADENVVCEELDDGSYAIQVAIIKESALDALEDGTPILESDDSDWVVFPTGYEFGGNVVRGSTSRVDDSAVRKLL